MLPNRISYYHWKTDVKGLKDFTFEGGSLKARKEATITLDELYPNRDLKFLMGEQKGSCSIQEVGYIV